VDQQASKKKRFSRVFQAAIEFQTSLPVEMNLPGRVAFASRGKGGNERERNFTVVKRFAERVRERTARETRRSVKIPYIR
jgi:hypothetical protein